MSYQQVKDLAKQAHRLKSRVEQLCEERRQVTKDGLHRELFIRVTDHQQRARVVLEKFADEATQGILQTWIQFSGYDEIARATQALSGLEHMSDEEVVQEVLAADMVLLNVFRLVAGQARVPRVREYFETLLEIEDGTARAIGREVNGMQDLREY